MRKATTTPGLTRATVRAAARHFEDVASTTEFELAAIERELFQLGACSLDLRLCTRGGKPETLSHLLLGESLPFG